MSEEIKTHLVSKVFDNLKDITPALIAVDICTGLFIFLPEEILLQMRLNLIPDSWYLVISLIFIFCISLTIVIGLRYMLNKVYLQIKYKKRIKGLRTSYINLNKKHKNLIKELLRSQEKSLHFNYYSGDIKYLVKNAFIYQTSNMTTQYGETHLYFPYSPQPWLIDLYNREPELFE